jgi:hypothetical protein
MDWTSFELWSDIAGAVGGVMMAIPAWKADSMAQFVTQFSSALKKNKDRNADPNANEVMKDVKEDARQWTSSDRWLLRGGTILIALAFVLKVLHHLR